MEDEEGVEVQEIDDDEDIYGDLESDIFLAPAKRPRVDDLLLEEHQTLTKENEALKVKVKQLHKENCTFSRNISALYLTAKNEIEKKNHIIKNLMEKLKHVTKSKSNLSPSETEEIIVKCQEALQESQAQITLNEIKKSLAKVDPSKFGKRKHIKFGNMSLYFFREEGSFQRGDPVEFPKVDPVPEVGVTSAEGSHENSEASHKKACGKNNHLEEIPRNSSRKSTDRPSPTTMSSKSTRIEDDDVHALSTNESKIFSASRQDAGNIEQRSQRIYDKDPKLIEPDRRRHSNPRTNSNERQNNNKKYGRPREYSPPSNDRRSYKRDINHGSSRSVSREEHVSHKSENTRRQSSRNQDSRLRPYPSTRHFLKDSKNPTSTNGKHRSRSKSK